jgi:hypothetical protein
MARTVTRGIRRGGSRRRSRRAAAPALLSLRHLGLLGIAQMFRGRRIRHWRPSQPCRLQ